MHSSRCSFAIGFPSNHFYFTNGLVLRHSIFFGGGLVKAGGVGEGGGGGGVGDGGEEERGDERGEKGRKSV